MPPASTIVLGHRYELSERIGVGGFSEVWRGTDAVLGRPVAVKVLQPGYARHPEVVARFSAEARHAARLSHEHIARVYDYGEQVPPASPFLVMELVDGPSLAAVLASGPLGPARTMTIVAQAAAGLHAAHSAGVVHRDIKPGNLLLADGGAVKITDFGISVAVGTEPVTSTGMLLGTPGYLAPERVTGSRATPASDLYALGVVAYECLAGTAPFTGVALEVAAAHRERPLPPLPSSVPAAVAALVRELTAKHPGDRPASAGEVARRATGLAPTGAPLPAPAGAVVLSSGRQARALAAAAPNGSPTVDLGEAALGPGAPAARRLRRGAAPPRVPGRRWSARTVAQAVMPVAAAAVIVATGSVIAAAAGPARAPRAAVVPSATPTGPYQPAVTTVDVRPGSLAGQPVAVAVRRLRRHDLRVRITWLVTTAQLPGTVLSADPAGPRPADTLVTLTAAAAPPPPRAPAAPGPSEPPEHGPPPHPHPPRGGPPFGQDARRFTSPGTSPAPAPGHHHPAHPHAVPLA